MKNKAVFFDRDGVINHLIERENGELTSPKTLEDFVFLPKAKEAVKMVQEAGFMTFVVTNQPGIEDKEQTHEQLKELNEMLIHDLGFNDVFAGIYRDSIYYKPRNDSIEFLINKYKVDRHKSYMIGDRWKDIVPGNKSKLVTIHVGNDWDPPEEYSDIKANIKAEDVYEACKIILRLDNARL